MAFITYQEVTEIWHNIRPHFLEINNVASMFGVSAHCAGPVALVEVVRALFGGEREATEACAFEEGLGGMHLGCRSRRFGFLGNEEV